MSRIAAILVAGGLVWLSGCTSGEGDGQTAESSEPIASLSGRYHLIISQNAGSDGYVDIYAARLSFPKESGGEIKLEHATPAFPSPKLIESGVEQGRVRLVFNSQGDEVDFEGRLDRGGALGSFCVGGLQCMAGRLIPEKDSHFDDKNPANMVSPAAGSSELTKLRQDGADFEDLLGFCRRNPKSPAIVDVYGELAQYLGAQDFSEEQVRDFAETYIKAASRWGERMSQIARMNVGFGLAMTEHLPELGLEYLREAEQKLPPPQAEEVRRLITQAEEIVRRSQARELIASGDIPKAVEILQPLKEKRHLDPVVTYLLARAAEKAEQTDQALGLYGELVALPQFESILVNNPGWKDDDEQPGDALERLWEQTHGGSEGLSDFLNTIYVESVERVAASGETPAPAESGSRTVLAELFTGSACPPCVAADVAGMALEATYERADLIVLRYHQHSPAEDPLANEHGAIRFDYYAVPGQPQGTPTFVVNGERVNENVGGALPMAPAVYGVLRERIDPAITQDSQYTLDVSADEQDGELTLRAAVEGDVPENLRLRLVLAEDDLSYEALNGVRQHRLIVRHMPGGPEGLAPTEGKLAFDDTISREELRRTLLADLARAERGLRVRFPVKPLELKPLYFVAFLQNERTREIVQVAGVPVTAEMEAANDAAAATPAADTVESGEPPAAASPGDEADAPRPEEAAEPQTGNPASGGPALAAPRPEPNETPDE